MSSSAILRPGSNCWRIEPAHRAAVLIDAADYFGALRAVLGRAQRSIFLIGWDVDSQLLLPGVAPGDDLPDALGEFLDTLTSRRPSLEVFIQVWDFVSLYADAAEWLPLFQANWKTHGRLHFHMDDRHPPGATQHQKLVVIDDEVAFCGGLDLRAPAPETQRHDVQAMVQGAPARALGELARARWERATGKPLRFESGQVAADLWPEDVPIDFEQVATGIARTEPPYLSCEAVREIEQLYLDAIAAASDAIYIENHYLSAPGVADALAERLRDPAGPAVVVVLPRASHGWLAENEIGLRQAHLIRRLRDADTHGRLRACSPHRGTGGNTDIHVGGKVLIVDDRLLSIGSANVSQRSMRLDAELNLVLEADAPAARARVRQVHARLLGGYLGGAGAAPPPDPGENAGAWMLRLVDAQGDGERGLRGLEVGAGPAAGGALSSGLESRPEHPVSLERLSEMLVPPAPRRWSGFAIAGLGLLLAFAAMAAVWYWTPVSEWLNVEHLAEKVAAYRDHPFALPLVIGAYLVGGVVVAPITLLVAITVLAFGIWRGIVYALLGAMASASAVYGLGHAMGRDSIRRLAGTRLNRVSHALAKQGILAMVLVRWIPLAPFSVVNLIAGASHIRFRHYLIGSAIGIFVDILFIALVMRQLQAALREPGWGSIGLIVVLLAAAAGAALALRAWLRRLRL